MALSDLAVFSEYAYSTMTEMQAQQIALFNAATRGGMVLRGGLKQGDYADEAVWGKIAGLVKRRDAYGSGAVAEKVLTHLVDTMVKVAAGTPPVRIDPGMMRWIARSPEEAGVVVGRQLAEDSIADMLNTSILACVAALSQITEAYYDHSGTGTTSLIALNTGAALFGDRAASLAVWIMHSKTAHDIYGDALVNTNRLFVFGTVRVVEDGFGRPLVMTDSTNLINTTPVPDNYYTIGLAPGGVDVVQNADYEDNVSTLNGDENIIRTFQAEWTYNLGIKGFAWDKSNGGASPNDTALGTATNWDRYATSHKDLAGVLIESK